MLHKENFNMWVTSGSFVGHIWIVLWISGSNGSTGETHFQPCSRWGLVTIQLYHSNDSPWHVVVNVLEKPL